jgi:hypothetical protein
VKVYPNPFISVLEIRKNLSLRDMVKDPQWQILADLQHWYIHTRTDNQNILKGEKFERQRNKERLKQGRK